MYYDMKMKMFYNETNPVYCPFSKKQCTLRCPLVKQTNDTFTFYCGSMGPMYDVEHVDADTYSHRTHKTVITVLNLFKRRNK